MGIFKSSQVFPITVSDLTPVANDVMEHFKQKEFETIGEKTLSGGWDISITKSGIFKTVLGLKTALKIEIEPMGVTTNVKAGVGAFGSQVIPTLLTLFVAWPVVVTQMWGLIQNSKLDDEALECVKESLTRHAGSSITETPEQVRVSKKTCASCGEQLKEDVKFCYSCGAKIEGPKACPKCNTQLPVSAKFCSACGTKAA
ncbi:MAG: hypothetical protein B6D35_06020 [Candidatus Brocadia sp. UTAMX2]|jgi:RNA polymerase subunit RPABC4/transcription elongation factor Spt4|nr:MAG: hypothetical protein B6D35_06020 [Candidatus Brocadia sp. UTAMX2]